MALSINTNVASLQMQRSLYQAQGKETEAMRRLSTGKRVNSAADDAAALFTIEKQTMDIRASRQVDKGLSDGISYAQVAEGALSEIQKMLQRAKEIAVQAANATVEDRSGLEKEWLQIKAEIDRITQSTEVFGKNPLQDLEEPSDIPLANEILQNGVPFDTDMPANGKVLTGKATLTGSVVDYQVPFVIIPAGTQNFQLRIDGFVQPGGNFDDRDINIFTKDGKHLAGNLISTTSALTDYTLDIIQVDTQTDFNNKVALPSNGFNGGASYDASNLNNGAGYSATPTNTTSENGMLIAYTGDYDREPGELDDGTLSSQPTTVEIVTINKVTEDLIVWLTGSGDLFTSPNVRTTATWDYMPEEETPIKILTDIRPDTSSFVTINKAEADTTTLGINALDMTTQSNAQTAIDTLESAMDTISGYRTTYGAIVNRMETTKATTTSHMFNIEQSKSRIEDTDFAQETAAMTRSQILKQDALSMMSHAKSSQQSVMALLSSLPRAA